MTQSNFPARRFQMVDVFAEQLLYGNPLPVVVDSDGLSGEDMLRITRWMNQSETTFLLPPSDPKADYRVRIFTLERELPFAGHPTLGTCYVWLQHGGQPNNPELIVQECGAGLIPIRRQGKQLAFAAPPLQRSGPVEDAKIEEVANVLRISRREMVDIEWVDNGPGWIGVLLGSAKAVLELDPAGSHEATIDIGVVGPYPQGHEFAFELRAFYTDQNNSMREDPVTGSLNASVAQWLIASGRAQPPYMAHQGTCLGRSGRIHVAQEGGEIWIGGRVISLIEGTCSV